MTINTESGKASGPLAGIVVADLSRILAGPYCTMLLGDMGATVIKVESATGDDTRAFRPPVYDGEATYFMSANRNKSSVVLDFATSDGRDAAQRIIAGADIVVENFRPGTLARFGLDYDSLSEQRPDLIYASITGFGDQAPSHLLGYDMLVQALSGFIDITGPADGTGYRAGFPVFDVLTGLHTAVGILAALHHRAETGLGQRVSTNLLSVALSSMVNQTQPVAVGMAAPVRTGNAHPSITPYEVFHCADKPLVIAVGNDPQFAKLCTLIGRADLAEDPRFATNELRNEHREVLRGVIATALQARDAADWWELLAGAGVPSAPVQSVAEGFRFAEGIGLTPVQLTEDRGIPVVSNPLEFSRSPVNYRLSPPRLDADGPRFRDAEARGGGL